LQWFCRLVLNSFLGLSAKIYQLVYIAEAGVKMPPSMQNHTYDTLLIDSPAPHILQVTLNRPDAANAFNTQMATDLMHCFEQLALEQVDYRCIILTGAGERAFCAGGDLKERDGMSNAAWIAQHLIYERMIRAVIDCPVPVIAAVNGAAYGGGCELAAGVDFVYAAERARFAMTETSLGIIPGAGGTQTLARALGERRAKELIMSARPFSATEALQWGLVNAVFAGDQLLAETLKTAEIIAANAPVAVRQARQAIHRGLQMSIADGLAFEIEAYHRTVPTSDRREGVRAFVEKRKPEFKGE
jgi:enoyl-CoA hydratase/carnithine racemase